MVAKKIDQAVIIILDSGKNVNTEQTEEKQKSFFHKAKECTARIVEKKIINQGKDLIGLIILGSNVTKNKLAEQCPGAFKNIELLAELQTPTWNMIRKLPETTSMRQGDWFDALIVAADHFQNGLCEYKPLNKKIILMTNFQKPACLITEHIEGVLNGFKEESYEVDIIGLDINDPGHKGPDIDLARQFVHETNGTTASFEDVMSYLLFHRKKSVNPRPYNVDLTIGKIKIPVSSYIRLKDEPIVKSWGKAIKDPITCSASTTESVIKTKLFVNTENQDIVKMEDVIQGYPYGNQIIPFSECDKTMLYESGEKCLSVYGFTDVRNVKWEALNGDGLSYVFGRNGNNRAQLAIKCLVECLHETNLVGIVRRVYNNGNAPRMFVLMPVIDSNDFLCLSLAGICYKEEINIMSFPPTNLNKYQTTLEQVNAFKNLIKAMDLTKAYDDTFDDTEAFPIGETVSPSVQYVLDCISYRALNPGKPLPPPRNEITVLFQVPPLINERCKEPLSNLKKIFTLNNVEVKSKKHKKIEDNYKYTEENVKTFNQCYKETIKLPLEEPSILNEIKTIETLDPISDYKSLKDEGKSFAELAPEMTKAIEDIALFTFDNIYARACAAMSFFRSECVQYDPCYYNDWLKKFKDILAGYQRNTFRSHWKEKNLSYILKEENDLSSFVDDDNNELYNDSEPEPLQYSIDPELNALIDEAY